MLHLQIICGNNPSVFLKWRHIFLISFKSSVFKLLLYSCILPVLWKNSQEWNETKELKFCLQVFAKCCFGYRHRTASEYFNRTDLLNIFILTAAFPLKSSHRKYFSCPLKSVSFCTLTHKHFIRDLLVQRLCSNYFCCYSTVIDETMCSSHTDSPQKVLFIFEDILKIVFQV